MLGRKPDLEEGFYRCEFKIISRKGGRSAPAGAAYLAGVKIAQRSATASAAYLGGMRIEDARSGKVHDYTKKHGVAHQEVLLPAGAPDRFKDPAALWNAAEQAEKRKDAQVGRLAILSLPKQFTPEQRLEATRDFLKGFVAEGMAVHFAIHDPHQGSDNHHAHALMTMRKVTKDGFFHTKTREWNATEWMAGKRAAWAAQLNAAAKAHGYDLRFDHQSGKARGAALEPVHLPLKQLKEAERGKVRPVTGLSEREAAFAAEFAQAGPAKQRVMRHPKGPWTQDRKAFLANARNKDGYARYAAGLERNARRLQARGLQLRAQYQQAAELVRESMRDLQTASSLTTAAALKARKEALEKRRKALQRGQAHQTSLVLVQRALLDHDAAETRGLDRLGRYFDSALERAFEERERQKLKREALQLRAEQQAFIERLRVETDLKIQALRERGRHHEADALEANRVLFATAHAPDEVSKQARADLARMRVKMGREADRLERERDRRRHSENEIEGNSE